MTVLPFTLPRPRTVSWGILAAAAATFVVALLFIPAPRLWTNALQLGWFLVGIGLAAPALMAINDLAGARWHEPVRPAAQSVARILAPGCVLVLVSVLFGNLYPHVDGHSFRAVWLAAPFVIARSVIYIALWLLMSRLALRRRFSAAFVVMFGFTVWLASVDWIMALDGGWASTIFGVYQFSGLLTAGIAVMTMIAISQHADTDTLHDLGKLLFAFSTFWMYIWFCQYMLIWYGNMPDETGYFAQRLRGNWAVLFATNVLLNWVVPFVVLLPQRTKRNRVILFRVAALVLVGHWLDLYLSIFPSQITVPAAGIGEVLAAAAAIVIVALSVYRPSRA